MIDSAAILNEREARDARAAVAEIDRALSKDELFEPIVSGLPPDVVNGYRRALASQRTDLQAQLDAYEAAQIGDHSELKRRTGNDPGVTLIVARIVRGWSQKELARRLGLKEQQIQRYEADRYRSISLSNYRRIAHVLGVHWEMKLSGGAAPWLGSGWEVATHLSTSDVKTVIKHARKYNWFDDNARDSDGEENYLVRYVTDHILNYGSPTLLRTGMNLELVNDVFLVAWKARVTRVAERIIAEQKIEYRGLNIAWLCDLVRLSVAADGPVRARDLLMKQGIVLVPEPQIIGLKLDGAAFLVGSTPVIGLTLRRDTLDNFWFTLLHEIAHVILHYRTGLRAGFFDDTEKTDVDEIEEEANAFASNMLISDEKWQRAPARISKSAEVIERFAKDLEIHSAIVFGRLQKERGDYRIFSDKIGRNLVRTYLLQKR